MKGSLATSLLVLCVCVLAARVRAQGPPECPVTTAEELGSTAAPSREGFIAAFLRTGESGLPLVQLFDFSIVCFNSGTSRNRYKRLSLVANYSCSDGKMTFDLYYVLRHCADDMVKLVTHFIFKNSAYIKS